VARIVAAALLCAAVPAACVRTPEVRYYTLTADGPARPRVGLARYTVRVGPASVPHTLDRPELVLRVSATRLAIEDGHRWAEPLRTGIARAVAADLALELDGARVAFDEAGAPRETTDVEVAIDVQRLDVKWGEGVAMDIGWTARWAHDGPTRTGRSVGRVPVASGGSYDAGGGLRGGPGDPEPRYRPVGPGGPRRAPLKAACFSLARFGRGAGHRGRAAGGRRFERGRKL
jgi:uncharacterized lipoprotein YmbA